ncbi:MFS transporter [Bosea thiooxidans]|nr:MFS transporter [Bosea sp. (in: a-proteobacteria)]
MRMTDAVDEQQLIRRIVWRIMPMVIGLYLCAIIDRSNIGFAKLQMIDELHLTEVGFAFGSSLFFFSYVAVEIPSALAALRFGARLWFARIAFTWGLLTVLLAFSNSGLTFYLLRFLLGAAEGGLYPAVIFYLTLWFPERHRARAVGLLTLGSAFGNMLSALVAGPLLDLHGAGGFSGWQWVFIATGLPPILLAFVVLKFLPSRPSDAGFLTPAEKDWLRTNRREPEHHGSPLGALLDPRVLTLAIVYTLINISLFGVIYWLPTVIKGFGVSGTQNGLLNAVPWALAAVLLLTLPRRLESERGILTAAGISTFIGLCCFAAATMLPSNTLRFAALALGTPCISILFPCFWFFPARLFKGARGAAGIAVINTIGLLGGFLGQNLMPSVAQATGSPVGAMIVPAVCLAALFLASLMRGLQPNGRESRPIMPHAGSSEL